MDANRYVQLTAAGLERFNAVRRRYRATVDDIAGDRETPSVNTVKRALRQGPVFVSTLERVWGYFQRRAEEERGEDIPALIAGEDYAFVESSVEAAAAPPESVAGTAPVEPPSGQQQRRRGWLSRQVPPPNRLFTGRRDVLDRLHTALTAADPSVSDPQAITGMGGMGKTQTAIAYLYAHRNDYDRVFWVNAETVESLNDGLAAVAEEIASPGAPVPTRKEALARAHDWFRNEADWLLVLDNADDLPLLTPYFPRHHNGRLLLTTRARNTVRWAAPVALAKFGRKEGALLLLRRAGLLGTGQALEDVSPDLARAAAELSAELDGLALALGQAGAYLAEGVTSVGEYLAEFRRRGVAALDGAEDGAHQPVRVTFQLALEQMARRGPYGAAAVEMVRLCAFLAPDAMPETLFAASEFAPYEEICAAVCGYSLAARNPKDRTLSVHRLVQQVAREALNPAEQRLQAERAVIAVARATPDFEFEDWPQCDMLLPHWRVCAEHIREFGFAMAEAAYLLHQAGRYLRARALYEEAGQFLPWALEIAERVYGPTHRNTADHLDELACLYRETDRFAEAEPLHDRSLAITEQVEGPDASETAGKLHNRALLYVERQDYARAEALFLRALAIWEKRPDEDAMFLAASLTQLGGVYRVQKDFGRAEPCYRRALAIYEREREPGHIEIATASSNLGLLCVSMEAYEEADRLFQRALEINERARGREHPETGVVLWNMAWGCWKQRRNEEAEELFRRALRIYTQSYGPEHSRVARLQSVYAEFRADVEQTHRSR